MNDETAFLDALRAAPTDATLLLVYADWLEERGDLRAEYIRLMQRPEENEARIEELRPQFDSAWATLIDGCAEKVNDHIHAELLKIDQDWQDKKSAICGRDPAEIVHGSLGLVVLTVAGGSGLFSLSALLFFVYDFLVIIQVGLTLGVLVVCGVVFGRLCIVVPARQFLMQLRYRRAWRAYRQRRAQVRDWLPPPPA